MKPSCPDLRPITANRRLLLKVGGLGLIAQLFANSRVLASTESKRERNLLEFVTVLCDAVIPATDTAGAVDAGVPVFIVTALEHGLFGGDGETLAGFELSLSQLARKPFSALAAPDRSVLLHRVDAYVFGAERADLSLLTEFDSVDLKKRWRSIKEAIVVGYFTSEAGGSGHLAYDLVPGENYRADIAIDQVPYLSNYWIENAQ